MLNRYASFPTITNSQFELNQASAHRWQYSQITHHLSLVKRLTELVIVRFMRAKPLNSEESLPITTSALQ